MPNTGGSIDESTLRVIWQIDNQFQTAMQSYSTIAQNTGANIATAMSMVAANLTMIGQKAQQVVVDMHDMATAIDRAATEAGSLIQATRIQIEGFTDALIAMSARVPQSAEDLGSAYYDVLSAGITDVNEALYTTELAARAASAGLTDAATAARAGIQAQHAAGEAATDLTHIYDVQFETVRLGITRYEDLSTQIGRMGSAARLAGQDLEAPYAAFVALTQGGYDAAESGTRVSRVMQALAKPETIAALKSMGVEAVNVDGSFRDLGDIVHDLNKQTADMTESQAAAALAMAFPNIRAREGISTIMLLSDTYDEAFTSMQNNTGAMAAAFAINTSSMSAQLQILQNEVDGAKAAFGERMQPALERHLELQLKYYNALAKLPGPLQEWGGLIMMVGGSILSTVGDMLRMIASIILITSLRRKDTASMWSNMAAYIANKAVLAGYAIATAAVTLAGYAQLALMKLQLALTNFHTAAINANIGAKMASAAATVGSTIALAASTAATWLVTAATWAWNVALYANPLVWIIALIVALIVVIILLVKHWDKVKAAGSKVWAGLKEIGGKLKEVGAKFKEAGTAAKAWGKKASEAAAGAAKKYIEFWGTIKDKIMGVLGNLWTWIKEKFMEGVKDAVKWGGDLIKNLIKGAKDAIRNMGHILVDALKGLIGFDNPINDAMAYKWGVHMSQYMMRGYADNMRITEGPAMRGALSGGGSGTTIYEDHRTLSFPQVNAGYRDDMGRQEFSREMVNALVASDRRRMAAPGG